MKWNLEWFISQHSEGARFKYSNCVLHLNYISNWWSVKNPSEKLKATLQINLERKRCSSHLSSTEQCITDAVLKAIKWLNSYAGNWAVTAWVADQNLNLELFLSSGCQALGKSRSKGHALSSVLSENWTITTTNYNGYQPVSSTLKTLSAIVTTAELKHNSYKSCSIIGIC